MPAADATKEPRRVKCRAPTEAEIALAVEEASKMHHGQRTSERNRAEGAVERGGSGEPEEPEEAEGGSAREEESQERGEDQSSRMTSLSAILGKRVRPRSQDSGERAKKLRPRISIAVSKP